MQVAYKVYAIYTLMADKMTNFFAHIFNLKVFFMNAVFLIMI